MKFFAPLFLALSTTLITGCGNSHLDCNTDENIDLVESNINKQLENFASQSYRKPLRYHLELIVDSFEQREKSESLIQCNYTVTAKLGAESFEKVNVSTDIYDLVKGSKSHGIEKTNIDVLTLRKAVNSAIEQTKKAYLQEKASQLGYKDAEHYQQYLDVEALVSSKEGLVKKLNSEINKLADENEALINELGVIEKEIIFNKIKLNEVINANGLVEFQYGAHKLSIKSIDVFNNKFLAELKKDASGINFQFRIYSFDKKTNKVKYRSNGFFSKSNLHLKKELLTLKPDLDWREKGKRTKFFEGKMSEHLAKRVRSHGVREENRDDLVTIILPVAFNNKFYIRKKGNKLKLTSDEQVVLEYDYPRNISLLESKQNSNIKKVSEAKTLILAKQEAINQTSNELSDLRLKLKELKVN